ncbi:MAG: ferredoxin [Acidimicrobiales bacterium]
MIDQDLCTGDGICTDHRPEVFVILEDGIAYVRQDGLCANDPGGSQSLAQGPGTLRRWWSSAPGAVSGECIRRGRSRVARCRRRAGPADTIRIIPD